MSIAARHHSSTVSAPAGPTPHFQTLLIAHALFCVFGFAIFLPAGVLLARYLRTFRPWWYTGHWIAQFGAAGPAILIGTILGYMGHGEWYIWQDTWGRPQALYAVQCIAGAGIHFYKPKNATGRPIQNYLHALFGIVILILRMYQIRTGYLVEWPQYSGMGALPSGLNGLWIFWCVFLILAYSAGMWFIPKQYRQEAAGRASRQMPLNEFRQLGGLDRQV
ncbi:hypothetical protein B0H16DRAFT_1733277 [Mycena metata]|uniref:Cytochrome b561 domain-containing protein n=1 Tax=Mycena metata TaxID=1033252 RepID=A0AAD7HZY5_9AGAR|nr:hypothetical protein B0H16DRAFT_1733277 [Mycena metata]